VKSRATNRTPEQKAFVNSIVPPKQNYYQKKVRKPKYKYVDPVLAMTKEEKCMYYIKNCNFWITEYLEGRTTEVEFDKSVKWLFHHYDKLKQLNNGKQ